MTTHYQLPDTPPIPGIRFRPLSGPDDADILLALLNARADHDAIDPLSSVESLSTREDYAQTLASLAEPGNDGRSILAEVDGRPAGFNWIFDWPEGDGTRVWLHAGSVAPAWRGRGLGTALLHWSERRIRELAAAQPGRWEFAANAASTETEATALVIDNGYRAAYTVVEMGLDWAAFTPTVALPAGIEIRPTGVEHADRVAASVDESYRQEYDDGRYSERFDPDAYAVELAGAPHDPTLWAVAWAGDEVVGQVIPMIERGRAEIYEVSVRPGWRRGGVARALLSAALLELRERGVEVVRLHTMAEFRTRALDLYESLGFRVLKEFPRYRKASDG